MASNLDLILKLGGSVITYKHRPLHANIAAVDRLCQTIKQAQQMLLLVHGGGSFGHYFAQKYDISRVTSPVDPLGVAKTRRAMLTLNSLVLERLERHRVAAYSLPPTTFMRGRKVLPAQRAAFDWLLGAGITPVTFGDVMPEAHGHFILSGDEIAALLTPILRPRRVVFTIDVDGVLVERDKPDSLLRETRAEDARKILFTKEKIDVTGGMSFKLQQAYRIARHGVDVAIVNGFNTEATLKALKGEPFHGTLIRGATVAQT